MNSERVHLLPLESVLFTLRVLSSVSLYISLPLPLSLGVYVCFDVDVDVDVCPYSV